MGTVLIVDDVTGNTRLLESLLAPDGHAVRTASDGAEALWLVRSEHPDLVLMDVMMPRVDGFEACRAIKQDPGTRLIPVVLVTALNDTASRIRGIEAGADDFLSKPFNAHELRAHVRSLLRIKRYTDDLDSAESVIVSLALTIEARDRTTDGHCHRLAQYGDRLCGELRSLRNVRPIVRHHHERLDGSGYPDGLRDGAIPLLAQVMGIVDVFDALTTKRPYKAALPFARAAEELRGEAARGWRRADLVATFLEQVERGQVIPGPAEAGSYVAETR